MSQRWIAARASPRLVATSRGLALGTPLVECTTEHVNVGGEHCNTYGAPRTWERCSTCPTRTRTLLAWLPSPGRVHLRLAPTDTVLADFAARSAPGDTSGDV